MEIRLPPNLATDSASQAPQNPAQNQVSAAEILTDAHNSRAPQYKQPTQSIQDLEELRSFQLAKRKDYEQQLNKNRLNYPQWMRYARWELDHNQDFRRFRSIMERALEVDAKHVPFWVRYIELELLHQNVNHGRNLLERAVSVLPRVDKLWFLYVQTEEAIGNFQGVRAVFERWLSWQPGGNVWESYIGFESRYNEHDHVRSLYLRYVADGPFEVWLKWVRYELALGSSPDQVARIRGVFEAAVDYKSEKVSQSGEEGHVDSMTDSGTGFVSSDPASTSGSDPDSIVQLLVLWINWEHSQGETDRAKAIYQKSLESAILDKSAKVALLDQLDVSSLETDAADITHKKLRFEQQLAAHVQDHDTWWEYAEFTEKHHGIGPCMQVLAQAVVNVPTDSHKSVAWRRYVFLWIKRALYAEYCVQDIPFARSLWSQARAAIPPSFCFAKLWILGAEFELRHFGVSAYRKTMGTAIGHCCVQAPKPKVLRSYIGLELSLGEYARVRKLYEKWAELAVVFDAQNNSTTAISVFREYIEFEKELGESERVAALYKLASHTSSELETERIEFLKDEFRYDEARDVLKASTDAHGWVRQALFESSILTPAQMDQLAEDEMNFEVGADHVTASRAVFEQGYKSMKASGDGDGANVLLDAWKEYEMVHGTDEKTRAVEEKRPKKVTRRRMQDSVEQVYYEYEFPDMKPDLSKFLANAQKWKAGHSA